MLDPAKSIEISKAEAQALALGFVGSSASAGGASDPTVDDAVNGAFNRFYTVADRHFLANVDAHDGRITSLVLADHVPTVPGVRVTEDDALRRQGGILVPDARIVGVNSVTGEVFRYSDVRHPYSDPPAPTIDRDAAIVAAVQESGLGQSASASKAELRVTFDEKGSQRLVWLVFLQAPIESPADAPQYTQYAVVEVDALTGIAAVKGRG